MCGKDWKKLLESKIENILDMYDECWIEINTNRTGLLWRFILWDDGDITIHQSFGNDWLCAEDEGSAICVLTREGNNVFEDSINFSDFLNYFFSHSEIDAYIATCGDAAIWDRDIAVEYFGYDKIAEFWNRYLEDGIQACKDEFWCDERFFAEQELERLSESFGDDDFC